MTGLEIGGGGWEVRLAADGAVAADGVVITGAGQLRCRASRVITPASWTVGPTGWSAHELARERAVNVCVVGSGETRPRRWSSIC